MTAKRREAASPNQAGGAENPATVSQQTTDFTPDPAAGPPDVPAPPGTVPAPRPAFGRYQVRRDEPGPTLATARPPRRAGRRLRHLHGRVHDAGPLGRSRATE